MDPHAMQVNLEPPLAATCSGLTMTASARRGAVRVEGPLPGTDRYHRAGRAPLRSRSMAARPPIGGRALVKGPAAVPSSSLLRSSVLVAHRPVASLRLVSHVAEQKRAREKESVR
jgi:hypothetical protein